MRYTFTAAEIEKQRTQLLAENPALELVAPCKIGEGIIRLSDLEWEKYSATFTESNCSVRFFIPASGSGSRMFQFLYDFLNEPNDENRSQVERFLNTITEFAFFKQIPAHTKEVIVQQTIDLSQIVSYLLNEEGLNFGSKPKGLIPFHSNEPFILNPIQEQLIQGSKLNNNVSFHFTIQEMFENQVKSSIHQLEGLTGSRYSVDFSEQAEATNSIAFNEDYSVCFDEKGMVTRPSGHGALLPHLNTLEEEFIFIKNIDNVQHYKYSSETIETWKMLGGFLLAFRNDAHTLFNSPTKEGLLQLNNTYQLYSESQLDNCSDAKSIRDLLNRPFRICGMVKNEGQPGGGPFWVNKDGIQSKQIVEKAQISMKGDQYRLMVQSTHFNPVMIVASRKSLTGEWFDLVDFKDESSYFIVQKKHRGQSVRFIERPGLWNGGMAHWNTLFLEIPSSTFSPVKTVLDLLGDAHK